MLTCRVNRRGQFVDQAAFGQLESGPRFGEFLFDGTSISQLPGQFRLKARLALRQFSRRGLSLGRRLLNDPIERGRRSARLLSATLMAVAACASRASARSCGLRDPKSSGRRFRGMQLARTLKRGFRFPQLCGEPITPFDLFREMAIELRLLLRSTFYGRLVFGRRLRFHSLEFRNSVGQVILETVRHRRRIDQPGAQIAADNRTCEPLGSPGPRRAVPLSAGAAPPRR